MKAPTITRHPWFVSSAVHGFLGLTLLILFLAHMRPHLPPLEIIMVEAPKVSSQAIEIEKPKPIAIPKTHQVYGVSRKAITAEEGLSVKQGNTLAKTPDNDQLKASDADSLPIPSDDYLVTQMPQLEHEVFVPYPPDVKKRGIQGIVVMNLLIDANGTVRQVDLIEGPDPSLSAAAVSAAHGFKFKPALIQEKPVAVRIRYAYHFVIRG